MDFCYPKVSMTLRTMRREVIASMDVRQSLCASTKRRDLLADTSNLPRVYRRPSSHLKQLSEAYRQGVSRHD